MKKVLLALGVVSFVSPRAAADAAPLLPLTTWSQATSLIETREVYSEYVFVLCREGGQYSETKKGWVEFRDVQYVEITPDRPLLIDLASWPGQAPGERRKEGAKLFAVPRELAEPYKTATELDQAKGLPGEVLGFFNQQTATPEWADTHVTVTYRLQRKRAGDGLEIVRTSWNPLWQWYAALGLIVAAILFGGIWLTRRRRATRT